MMQNVLLVAAVATAPMLRAKLPDPECKAGVLSLKDTTADRQVCCPAYCGECTDYESCKSANGQDSENACCVQKLIQRACDQVADPYCVKSCKDGVAPCVMEVGAPEFVKPEVTSAAEDCDKAKTDWMHQAQATVEGATMDGIEQWQHLEEEHKVQDK